MIVIEIADNKKALSQDYSKPIISIYDKENSRQFNIEPKQWVPSKIIDSIITKVDGSFQKYLKVYGQHYWVMLQDLQKYYDLLLVSDSQIDEL